MESAAKKAKADDKLTYEELYEKYLEEKKGREEERKGREEEKKAREEEKKAREEEKALRLGTYYSRFTQAWSAAETIYGRSEMEQVKFSDLWRTNVPHCPCYRETLAEAETAQNVVTDGAADSYPTSHASISHKDKIWPCDILDEIPQTQEQKMEEGRPSVHLILDNPTFAGARNHPCNKDFKAPNSDKRTDQVDRLDDTDGARKPLQHEVVHGGIAHLVPASPLQASLYFDVAKWVFGLPADVKNPEVIQKLLHGSKPADGSKRHPHTGLKHFAANKIRLLGERQVYFDTHPSLLVLPILELDEMKAWNGEAYSAIVMIDCNPGLKYSLVSVASSIGMTMTEGIKATDKEVEMGRFVLETTLKLLAKSLLEGETNTLTFFTEKHKQLWETYRSRVVVSDENGLSAKVKLPVPNTRHEALARKIHFVKQGDYSGHPAPDPILLAVKAAVNWSKFHNQQLLPGGEFDEDDERSELSILAEEQYLQQVDMMRRQEPMPIETICIPAAAGKEQESEEEE